MDNSTVEKYKEMLKKLREDEGGILHKNKTEADITTGYGIYRGSNPTASVFTYLDNLAKSIGITVPSSQWTSSQIENVNSIIDDEEELKYTVEFYYEYFRKVDLDKLPHELQYPFFNIFVNSRKIAAKAIQSSCNMVVKNCSGLAKLFPNYKDLKVDGLIGSGTLGNVYNVSKAIDSKDNDYLYGEVWTAYFLLKAKSYYMDIVIENPSKYITYLNGWDNRVNNLIPGGRE